MGSAAPFYWERLAGAALFQLLALGVARGGPLFERASLAWSTLFRAGGAPKPAARAAGRAPLAAHGRGLAFFVAQFAAGSLVLDAGAAARELPTMIAGALLALASVLAPGWLAGGARRRLALAAITGLPALALLLGEASGFGSPSLAPRPIAGDRWSAADQLRLAGAAPHSVVLQAERHRARLADWRGELRAEWAPLGGAAERDLVLENAGPAAGWRILEGECELIAGPRSRLTAACRFPKLGGSVRLAPPRVDAPRLSVAAVWGTAGDHGQLAALLEELRPRQPDLVIGLGELVRAGDYGDLLAVRDAVDGLGTRSLFVPGAAETADGLARALAARLGGSDRLAACGPLAVYTVDSAGGTTTFAEAGQQAGLVMARTLELAASTFVLATRWPLAAPPGREDALMPDAKACEALLRQLPAWKVRLVLAAADGEGWDLERDGVRHLVLGRRDGRPDALVAIVGEQAVADVLRLRAPEPSRLALASAWRRCRAVGEEHPGAGLRVALAIAGIAAAVGCALGAILRLRRKHS